MKLKSNFCGIFATAFIVATVTLVSSCSQDDNSYESNMYTMAEEMSTRSGEPTAHPFPNINTIKSSGAVLFQAARAWDAMISDSASHDFKERGFLIYYRHSTGDIYCGEIITGTSSEVNFGDPSGNDEVCAFYHCHIPARYWPSNTYRVTGYSSGDVYIACGFGLPGLVDDYTVNKLKGGTPADSPHHIRTFGPDQRVAVYF